MPRPPKSRHIYVGQLSLHIFVREKNEYCEKNGIELHSLSHFVAFFKTYFEDEKSEATEFYPKIVTSSRFFMDEQARESLKNVEKMTTFYHLLQHGEANVEQLYTLCTLCETQNKETEIFLQINASDIRMCN